MARCRHRSSVVLGAVLAIAVTGCTRTATTTTTLSTSDDLPAPTTGSLAPLPSPTPLGVPSTSSSAPPSPSAGPTEDGRAVGACSVEDRRALEGVVELQLLAFAATDFAAARDLASASFREGIDLDTFQELITEQYAVVLESPDTDFGPCVAWPDRGMVRVTLTADDAPTDLIYLLVREEGGWRIDGAQFADPGQGEVLGTPV